MEFYAARNVTYRRDYLLYFNKKLYWAYSVALDILIRTHAESPILPDEAAAIKEHNKLSNRLQRWKGILIKNNR